jgi:glyoxylase-like metal-dependent hydrolase (beta-lactamase superfamily II)
MLTYQEIVDGIFLVHSDLKFAWKCNGIVINNVANSGNILIDCNFSRSELRKLIKKIGGSVDKYIATHVHLDHVNNTHIIRRLQPTLDILCPEPEHQYLMNIDKFNEANGSVEFGVSDLLKEMFSEFMGFKEIENVIGFKSDAVMKFGGIILRFIPITSHSPGHFALIIENTEEAQRKILFVSDIGIEKFGPWLGFKYNNIPDIKRDVKLLEEIYRKDDYILTSSHSGIEFEKKPEIFQKFILNKIDEKTKKVLLHFDTETPKSLNDLVFQGIIYRVESIEKYSAVKPDARDLWYFWEAGCILNIILELVNQQILTEVGTNPKVTEKKWRLQPPA